MVNAVEAILAEAATRMGRLFDEPTQCMHGVHIGCQRDEYVIAACGYLLDWSERDDESTAPACEACLAVDHCPVCGAEFEPTAKR